ncbi:unnamed protein product [Arctia plantaginis]|uniref:Peptidase S1 domain-containing protein n=1 Tax=Arctia plantaginis TaxID=874455 RepID=A0A8S1BIS5_ARCPL|nr:unnamed protein product [Arctia plantaginis]
MHLITLLAVCIAAVAASPETFEPSQRIVGGTVTTINQWPYQANVMAGSGNNFRQWCGGTIINNRNILSAAHCVRTPTINMGAHQMRLRLGSTWANSGGVVHNVAQLIIHPSYNMWTTDSDIMLLRSSRTIVYSNVIQHGIIAGPNYHLQDNQVVWVTGWGAQWFQGPASEQLRQNILYVGEKQKMLLYGLVDDSLHMTRDEDF